jgi:hypothetical protein
MNKLTAYIGRALKAGVVLTAAVAFLGGSFLCCCLSKTAHASTSQKTCCHKTKAQKSEPSKTCDHCKIRSVSDLTKTFDLMPSLAKSLQTFGSADVPAYFFAEHLTRLAYTGPPRAHPSLPIYLQVSCLRL